MLATESKDENDFIRKSKVLIGGMLTYDGKEIDDLFIDEPHTREDFHPVKYQNLKNIG